MKKTLIALLYVLIKFPYLISLLMHKLNSNKTLCIYNLLALFRWNVISFFLIKLVNNSKL